MPFVLDISAISLALGDAARRFDIDLVAECTSTNSVLMARAEAGAHGAAGGTVLVCEHQSAGRGRRGRAWVSAPGDSLTFSLLWRFPKGTSPAGLSLVAGLAVVRALAQTPVRTPATAMKVGAGGTASSVPGVNAQLKWPNDILLGGRKLGGILVELVPGAPHLAVIGIGLNLRLPMAMPDEVRATATALPNEVAPNDLLADVLKELLDVLERFSAGGFSVLREEWLAVHAFQDAPVRLLSDFDPPREGICRGVDGDGALLFEIDGVVGRELSGEVSLRSAE